jgi:hypothetical protein
MITIFISKAELLQGKNGIPGSGRCVLPVSNLAAKRGKSKRGKPGAASPRAA